MSHYTQNIQRLLTGSFKVLNVILKSKFGVKMRPRNFACLTTFISVFSQNDVRVWEKEQQQQQKMLGKVDAESSWRWRT